LIGDSIIAATHLRAALEAMGRIIGRTYSEELLAAVFSRFCVGK
jgi:tRNA modification GTPase